MRRICRSEQPVPFPGVFAFQLDWGQLQREVHVPAVREKGVGAFLPFTRASAEEAEAPPESGGGGCGGC